MVKRVSTGGLRDLVTAGISAGATSTGLNVNLESPILQRWIAKPYLTARRVRSLAESAVAKPVDRYLVLDDFFRTDAIDRLRDHCSTLQFVEDVRVINSKKYDSDVKFADSTDVGWDLFNSPDWHSYCANLVGAVLSNQSKHGVKFRYYRPDATGFWIHTDSVPGERSIEVVAYFNEGWSILDGALLQIWREDETAAPGVRTIEIYDAERSMGARFHTHTADGVNVNPKARDFVLVDQVVPEYNRLFMCNLQTSAVWHSVTPSRGRPRYGFVQWIN
jgi:hypothetical protein